MVNNGAMLLQILQFYDVATRSYDAEMVSWLIISTLYYWERYVRTNTGVEHWNGPLDRHIFCFHTYLVSYELYY